MIQQADAAAQADREGPRDVLREPDCSAGKIEGAFNFDVPKEDREVIRFDLEGIGKTMAGEKVREDLKGYIKEEGSGKGFEEEDVGDESSTRRQDFGGTGRFPNPSA